MMTFRKLLVIKIIKCKLLENCKIIMKSIVNIWSLIKILMRIIIKIYIFKMGQMNKIKIF